MKFKLLQLNPLLRGWIAYYGR
ncbi:MAG: hypothetical protein E5W49_26620, partial [Mesorhizobium sp.]